MANPAMLRQVQDPNDLNYKMARRQIIKDLMKMSTQEVGELLGYMAINPDFKDESKKSVDMVREIYNLQFAPPNLKGILDSTSGTTGNVLIRQDLEPLIYRLFVDEFPAWDRIVKLSSNGLVHAATQITSVSSGSAYSSFISELGTAPYETSAYNRATWPIAVMSNG